MGGSGNKSPASKMKSSKSFDSYSKYAKEHQETVDYIKKQTGVDLNKYRDGDGTSPFTTSYWDKNGFKVAVDTKHMDKKDMQALQNLSVAYGGNTIVMETGGAWFHYIYLKRQLK